MEETEKEEIFVCRSEGCNRELLDNFPEAKPVELFFGLSVVFLVNVSRKGLKCTVCGGSMRNMCYEYLV